MCEGTDYREREITMNTQYSIYQINPDRDKDRVLFIGSKLLKLVFNKLEVDPAIYDKVYDGKCGRLDSLEGIYMTLNMHLPEDYKCRSLSVSDVVEIKESESIEPGFYFVDSIGFKRINFDKTKCGKGGENNVHSTHSV